MTVAAPEGGASLHSSDSRLSSRPRQRSELDPEQDQPGLHLNQAKHGLHIHKCRSGKMAVVRGLLLLVALVVAVGSDPVPVAPVETPLEPLLSGEEQPCVRGAGPRCAPGLECFRADKKNKVGVCRCKSTYEVCGSDGVTYKNTCALKSANDRRDPEVQAVTVKGKGRCPQIISAQQKFTCRWITDFLTDQRQCVQLGKNVSTTWTISIGSPQGCVLSPLLFSLYTNCCTSSHDSVKLIKFADDTTLIGLISGGDESVYRREPPLPLALTDSPITTVDSIRFLGTTITQDLKWEPSISSLIKKAQQRMYFLRQLKKAKLPAQMMVQFYTAIIESILTSSITVWYAGATVRDRHRLQRIVRSAEKVIGCSLPSLQDLYVSRTRGRAAPRIVTPPGEVYNVSGSQVYLSCEAVGVPTPVLTWNKVVNGGKKKVELLPGDRDNLAVQTRGGPEKHEVTGWVLISPLTEAEQGPYECHASNSQGEASAVGAIHVVQSLDDITVKRVLKDEEL
ncbi:hypothetical protein WMY93_012024 [Mugilogobius chulae]|uniref:Ig-like domain-containing protein n=1 Tax=Mugilogobius chulae TaxID=88201 RepID=A0AAW0PAD7_9GOBI